jgi:electron transfer flavoprotein alpha subunit
VVAPAYDPSEEQSVIWILLEVEGETLADVSLELLSKGRELADEVDWPLVGVLLGHQVEPLISIALSHQADDVILIDHPLLESFTVDAYAQALHDVIIREKPSVILFGATHNSRDIAGRLAVRLRTGLNADCIDLRMDKERGILTSDVTGFGGGVVALLEAPDHRPQMATVRPGVFMPDSPTTPRSKQIRRLEVEIDESAGWK